VIEINANSMREFFSDIVAVIPCKEGVSANLIPRLFALTLLPRWKRGRSVRAKSLGTRLRFSGLSSKALFTTHLVLAFSAPKYKTVHENCGGEATTTLYSIQDIKIVVRCAVGYLLN
jgi:hypothetical protein